MWGYNWSITLTSLVAGNCCCGGTIGGTIDLAVLPLPPHVGQAAIARDDIEHHLAAFELETEIQFPQPGMAQGLAYLRLALIAVQHQEATTARPADLAANRSVS